MKERRGRRTGGAAGGSGADPGAGGGRSNAIHPVYRPVGPRHEARPRGSPRFHTSGEPADRQAHCTSKVIGNVCPSGAATPLKSSIGPEPLTRVPLTVTTMSSPSLNDEVFTFEA